MYRVAEVVVAGTLAGGVAPGPVVTFGTQVLAPAGSELVRDGLERI